ncbi:MAG: hypothetical protein JWO22_4155, partial [Frankiales bacterium]|nr:hypothetical protein [Frankiales bacterium]
MRRALLLAGVLVLSTAGPALADDVPATGSWTQLRLSAGLPDLQSQDGPALPVENGPTGAIAFSAVRWSRVADLSLARVDATGPVSTPAVWACSATTWTAGDRQPWSDRPTVDCTRHVLGVARGDRMTWRTSLLGSPVDVLLVPAPTDTSGFAISFGAPTVDSFSVASPTVQQPAPAPVEEPSAAPVVQPQIAAPVGVAVVPPPIAVPATVAVLASVPVPPSAPVVPGDRPTALAATTRQHSAWPGQLL